MAGFIPKEKLSAYQRWELAAFDEAEQNTATFAATEVTAAFSTSELKSAASLALEHGAYEVLDAPENENLPSDSDSEAVALPTAADIERMHEEAHQEGYAAGHAEGYQAGSEQVAALADRFDGLLSTLQQSLALVDQQIADQLLATAVELANQMVRQSLKIKPELIIPVVKEAVSVLYAHADQPNLLVHPDDALIIRQALADKIDHQQWRLIEDVEITPGGCRVEIGAGEVDATIETRWQRVLESIGIDQAWLDAAVGKPRST